MHSELKYIQDQKEQLKRKLHQVNRRVKNTKKIKNDRTEPWNKKKFLLKNKHQRQMGSTLVSQGLMPPSAKKPKGFGFRGTRSGLLHGRSTWGSRDLHSSMRSNLKRRRSEPL